MKSFRQPCSACAITALLVLGIWVGCGGSTETPAPAAVGGTAGVAGSGGGSAGTGGGSSGMGGVAGLSGKGGSAGTLVDAGGDTVVTFDVVTDSIATETSACIVFHQSCDMNNDQCCAPLYCANGPNGPWCRASTDGGLDAVTCLTPNNECEDPSVECCPGLECVATPMGKRCRFPEDAAVIDAQKCLPFHADCENSSIPCCDGMSCLAGSGGSLRCRYAQDGGGKDGGGKDGGGKDGGKIIEAGADGNLSCLDLYGDCTISSKTCCLGLECKTDAQHPDYQCLPVNTPDPDHCPPMMPQGPCSEVGLQCSYGAFAVCTCFILGWQCAL